MILENRYFSIKITPNEFCSKGLKKGLFFALGEGTNITNPKKFTQGGSEITEFCPNL